MTAMGFGFRARRRKRSAAELREHVANTAPVPKAEPGRVIPLQPKASQNGSRPMGRPVMMAMGFGFRARRRKRSVAELREHFANTAPGAEDQARNRVSPWAGIPKKGRARRRIDEPAPEESSRSAEALRQADQDLPPRWRIVSMITAPMMMRPLRICCQ